MDKREHLGSFGQLRDPAVVSTSPLTHCRASVSPPFFLTPHLSFTFRFFSACGTWFVCLFCARLTFAFSFPFFPELRPKGHRRARQLLPPNGGRREMAAGPGPAPGPAPGRACLPYITPLCKRPGAEKLRVLACQPRAVLGGIWRAERVWGRSPWMSMRETCCVNQSLPHPFFVPQFPQL